MMLKTGFFLAALGGASLIGIVPARAAQVSTLGEQKPGSEINLTADKLSTGNGANQIDASGNVVIKREGTTLTADEVHFNRATEDVGLHGMVKIMCSGTCRRSAQWM